MNGFLSEIFWIRGPCQVTRAFFSSESGYS
jgi:hypothetical protein